MASETALSFRPWTRATSRVEPLKDVLAQMSFERGHFRDITEASLQEEIAADGALELSESDDGELDEELQDLDKAGTKPTTREELYKAKFEMLQHVSMAEQSVWRALDFVSLLQSKDAPNQATSTISPFVKENVPVGSLGTDIWQRMPLDEAREAQAEMLAVNVRIESLRKSANSLLAAASRLQETVRNETRNWDQVLSISEKGWNVCRLPGQRHKLAITIGLNESAPQFSRRGIAALNSDSEGNIVLDRGVGIQPRALRVQLKSKDTVVATSRLPFLQNDGDITLETRIRHARDSLFDEELYHELVRESRSLASLGVSMAGSGIKYKPSLDHDAHGLEMTIELVSLDNINDRDASFEKDPFAQAAALAARLLLSQAHRARLKKRSQIPAPLSEKKDDQPLLPILRPIMSFILHYSALIHVNSYLERLEALLTTANIRINIQRAKIALSETVDTTTIETLITPLMRTWASEGEIRVGVPEGEAVTWKIGVETTLATGSGSLFFLTRPDHRRFRFSSLAELRKATDQFVASALASILSSLTTGSWRCNEREALLTKVADNDDGNRVMWVSLNGEAGALSLSSSVDKVSWHAKSDDSQTSFWHAWEDLQA